MAAKDRYLAEPSLPFSSGVCNSWCRDNRKRFPDLAALAMKYLSARRFNERILFLNVAVYNLTESSFTINLLQPVHVYWYWHQLSVKIMGLISAIQISV